ncbi:MAG: 50S ribosomal protein L24 [Verrucomicrobiota bacterium]
MQKRFHVKKGDEVVVIAGSEKGKRGKIIEVQSKSQRVIVEGAKMLKKHTKRSQNNPQGSIVEREGSIHISNVMAVSVYGGSKRRADKESAKA